MSVFVLMWMGCAGVSEPAVVAPAVVTPAPVVVEKVSRLEGEASKDHIRRIVSEHQSQVEYCYVKELAKDPGLAGKITVAFEISQGQVVSASVTESSLDNADVEKCLIRMIEGWRFADDQTSQVKYPFTFQPLSEEEADPEAEPEAAPAGLAE